MTHPDGRIRVAHVGGYAPDDASGVNKTISGLLHHLPQQDVDVEVWGLSTEVDRPTMFEKDGIAILEVPVKSSPLDLLFDLPIRSRKALTERSQQVDLVHFHSVFTPANVMAARAIASPYLVTPNGGYDRSVLRGNRRILKKAWFTWKERSYIKGAAGIQAVSKPEARYLQRLFPGSEIFFIPNAVPKRLTKDVITAPSSNNFLFLGRLAVQHKGLDLLIEGFGEFLRGSANAEAKLIIAGPDFRNGLTQLNEKVKLLDIGDHVEFRGAVYGDEKSALIEQTKVFVHTSRWEGLPFSVIEALAAGRPVLVTPETNLAEEVSEYRAGIVVEGSAKAVAEGLRRLHDLGDEEYRAMQLQARALVNQTYTWDRAARAMAEVYRGVVTRSGVPLPGPEAH